MKTCKRCGDSYSIKNISDKYINKNPELYQNCSYCRKYKNCKNCNKEFHHKQNQTCSKKCSKELKERSWIESCGYPHNFFKESKSRKKWENKLLEEEGIVNVFQRESVKNKSIKTVLSKYGVDNVSKNSEIKSKKRKTLRKTIKNQPELFKDNWHRIHKNFIKELGYDPRLHIFGKSSKESLEVFLPLLEWCKSIGIENEDIYLGVDEKKEFFISSNKKIYFYDFTIKSKKIIIEFHGVCFHANIEDPLLEDWRNPFTNETWKENLKKTKLKNNTAIQKGFKLLEIWSDIPYDENLESCKKFIIDNI